MPIDPHILESLVKTIELKDRCTAAHTWRVVLYSRALAEDAGLDTGFIERLTHAAALHDIGKIEIPDAILTKPTPLTDDEYTTMKAHTTLGHQLLLDMGVTDPTMLALVRHHHERWDGKGYPDRLAGEAIPLSARFFAVIDAFDAMTGVRPYRPSLNDQGLTKALEQLRQGRGSQFAPEAVDRFLNLFTTGDLDWILHYFNDECPVPAYDPAVATTASTHTGKPPLITTRQASPGPTQNHGPAAQAQNPNSPD